MFPKYIYLDSFDIFFEYFCPKIVFTPVKKIWAKNIFW